MQQMISLSHWGMFDVPGPILLIDSNVWQASNFDIQPGQIIRLNGEPHRCIQSVEVD